MNKIYKYIGKSYPIQDAIQKASGEMEYASDMCRGQLYIALKLSDIPHGAVDTVDSAEALAIPGVLGVFTHENTPAKCYNRYRTVPEQQLCPEDERILTERVRFVGDRVAAVVALSREAAQKAVNVIKVSYTPIPVISQAKNSISANAADIHESGNVIDESIAIYGDAAAKASKNKLECITVHIDEPRVHAAALEPHVCMARYAYGMLTVYSPTQGVYGARTVVSDYLDMPYNTVRVVKLPMGGSFGGKQEFVLEPLTAYIAKQYPGRMVCLQFDRRQDIIATSVRGAQHFDITLKSSCDGRLAFCSLFNLFDAGAYIGSSMDQSHAMQKKLTRQYRIPYYQHRSQVVYTNTTPAGGMRGWGSPEMFTAFEIALDMLAKKINVDPVEIRLKNMVRPHDIDVSTGMTLGNCRPLDCMRLGTERFRWHWRKAACAEQTGRYRHGVGTACGAHKNGMYNGSPDITTMTLKMNEDGTFDLIASLHEVGCGTLRSMQIVASEVLSTSADSITVTEGDTQNTPFDSGTYGSRITYVAGRCAQLAAEQLKERICIKAAELYGMASGNVTLEDGHIVGSGKRIPYKRFATDALLRECSDMIITYTHRASDNPGVYSAHFAEVEVDTLTGLVRVTNYLTVQDVGCAINRGMVEGQIRGGVQMGIGYALCEDTCVKENGMVYGDSFRKYHIINMFDMPTVDVMLVEAGGDNGPFNAKSVGEIATVPAAAAIVNAINNALGSHMSSLPLTPERILAYLSSKGE